ncbi:MAG: ATP-binding protein [Promethearchaeota archaeon]|jgi:NAD-dependent dihydropyrimidine dehydrogenase PreA subunit
MGHPKQGLRFENDWTLEHLETRTFQTIQTAITIPVNMKIKAENYVLSLENAKKILSKARRISITDCKCKERRMNCEAPLNIHIDMNLTAESKIKDGIAREITLDEALSILEQTHELGLVHMALGQGEFYEPGVINTICSCCSCCCGLLSGILRFGLAPHLITPQAYTVTDTTTCDDCGACAERCQFGAREIINGSLSFNPSLCFGCGLCVNKCSTHAIKIIEKPMKAIQPPKPQRSKMLRATC